MKTIHEKQDKFCCKKSTILYLKENTAVWEQGLLRSVTFEQWSESIVPVLTNLTESFRLVNHSI